MGVQFLGQNEIRRVATAATAATTAVNTSAVDTSGVREVAFMTTIAVANAGNYIKIQQSEDGSTGWADLEGSGVVAAANNDLVCASVYQPQERYVRAVVVRTASTAVTPIIAVKASTRIAPNDNVEASENVNSVTVISPDEGTAL